MHQQQVTYLGDKRKKLTSSNKQMEDRVKDLRVRIFNFCGFPCLFSPDLRVHGLPCRVDSGVWHCQCAPRPLTIARFH